MDRYQRVEKPRAEQPIQENEIRITSHGRMRNHITYGMTLLEEKGSSEIVFKAMGGAINKTVMHVIASYVVYEAMLTPFHQEASTDPEDKTVTQAQQEGEL
ncbi:hypothetical protein CTI12_AA244170 [Artemisia annua]|uniref:DNA/RNA-binding protein Alba-like domain-containing protein n=1 Tax=Artemisia annua TaxID=35608 RepID=A0A2U1NNM3_ARTAN|nr:hypothetical protein CTI12_AA244170 [Artemisia annua]